MASSGTSLGHFDVALRGTSLSSSILAAALAKAGKSVIHVDESPYYGGLDASLCLHELVDWAIQAQHLPDDSPFSNVHWTFPGHDSLPAELAHVSRQYALSLAPSLVPAVGPVVETLVRAGVSRYTGFRLLEAVALCSSSAPPRRVPASKEDVFNGRDLSLPQKRRLMKFLLFAAGEFEDSDLYRGREEVPFHTLLSTSFALDSESLAAVLYAVALCPSATETSRSALTRLRSFLRATGRYGNSPFLVGQYGGAGELAQGFCRVCAVYGGVYMLGTEEMSTETLPGSDHLTLSVGPETFTASVMVSEAHLVPRSHRRSSESAVHRAILILDKPILCPVPLATTDDREPARDQPPGPDPTKQAEAALFVIPPGGVSTLVQPVRALMLGEAALACPEGHYVIYLETPASPASAAPAQDILRPAVDLLLSSTDGGRVLFELFYTEHALIQIPHEPVAGRVIIERHLTDLTGAPGAALQEAHRVYTTIVGEQDGADLFDAGAIEAEEE